MRGGATWRGKGQHEEGRDNTRREGQHKKGRDNTRRGGVT